LLGSTGVWWLILAEQTTTVADATDGLTQEMGAVAEFSRDLDGRLATAGVQSSGGALDLYRRVERLLDGVPLADLEQALGGVQALVERLGALDRTVAAVRELKGRLDTAETTLSPPETRGRRPR
jgi:hypothetical protein